MEREMLLCIPGRNSRSACWTQFRGALEIKKKWRMRDIPVAYKSQSCCWCWRLKPGGDSWRMEMDDGKGWSEVGFSRLIALLPNQDRKSHQHGKICTTKRWPSLIHIFNLKKIMFTSSCPGDPVHSKAKYNSERRRVEFRMNGNLWGKFRDEEWYSSLNSDYRKMTRMLWRKQNLMSVGIQDIC